MRKKIMMSTYINKSYKICLRNSKMSYKNKKIIMIILQINLKILIDNKLKKLTF